MRKFLLFFTITTLICFAKKPLETVDPFIGTDGHGHTFPGATLPFGMVQLSPSNDFKGWDWCSGYHYSDSVLKGFAHTHISGPGLAGLGDILLMPTVGKILSKAGTEEHPETGYRSRFSHENESAYPGFYQVLLEDYQVNVELTCTERVGFHRYTYPETEQANIIIDPSHHISEGLLGTYLEILPNHQVRGYKHSNGEAGNRRVYFIAEFSKSPTLIGLTKEGEKIFEKSASGKNVKAYLQFSTAQNEAIEIKVALSHVSFEGAEKNLQVEGKNKNFNDVLTAAREIWSNQLSKITVNTLTAKDKVIFYTALYHSMISPNLYMDVDGQYKIGGKTYTAEYPHYSTFSTWDTFRATHPLLTIIEQNRTARFVRSLTDRSAVNGVGLPVWELLGYDNKCMIGYSTVPVIADAIMKDIPGIDEESAFAAMVQAARDLTKSSPNYDVNGIEEYLTLGYVPSEIGQSVSKTTEYCYHDWTIARVAEKLGKPTEQKEFEERAKSFAHHFHEETGFLWPKSSTGEWQKDLDMTIWDGGLIRNYVSGNIWAYSTFVPHGIPALIQLHGGKKNFTQFLDHIFSDTTSIGGAAHADISGFIGKYGHGDEPGHHMAYLYNYIGEPWKSQQLVREVMDKMYFDTPKGFENNEDLGQMSSWYVFSALGFYPVCPADGKYVFGSPLVNDAVINLENGNRFRITVTNNSKENMYIQSVRLNGKKYNKTYIPHKILMAGGTLEFKMSNKPNKKFGSGPEDTPDYQDDSKVRGKIQRTSSSAFMPFDTDESQCFAENRVVELKCNTREAVIHYTLDGSVPDETSPVYYKPMILKGYTHLRAIALAKDKKPSPIFTKEYFRSITNSQTEYPKITLLTPNQGYGKADGSQLIDGKVGSMAFNDDQYTGFAGSDMIAIIDLGKAMKISELSIGVLEDMGVWIFPAIGIDIEFSEDNENFNKMKSIEIPVPQDLRPANLERHRLCFNSEPTRYIKITVKGTQKCPAFHRGAGLDSFLFIDEILIY
ncbi:MAG: GH92 family glycosyl hydrolase [Candidatus Marinimicrobia bacterium]|nr:GH92 family glycosyl hydrolase [Candidatus Neomarinimicrobiota bacterium]